MRTILALLLCAGCSGASEPIGSASASDAALCSITFVWQGPSSYAYGNYNEAPCPAPGVNADLAAQTGDSAYDGWFCWKYSDRYCCAASASAKSECDGAVTR